MPLISEQVTIGRQQDNEFCLPDAAVSRRHCRVVRRREAYYISDLDSNNGTLVNGNLLTTEHRLNHGDTIEVGESLIRFYERDDELESLDVPLADDRWNAASTIFLDRGEAKRIASTGLIETPSLDSRQASNLQALLAIGRLITSADSVETLQAKLLATIGECIPAEAGAIVLVGYANAEPWTTFAWARDRPAGGEPRMSRSIVARVIEQQSAVLVSASSLSHAEASPSVVSRRVASAICVSMSVRDKVHGAIYLESANPRQPFDESHLKLLTAISGYAALAFDHASRVERLRAENERLRSEVHLRHTMIGDSPRMKEVYERLRKIAGSDATVLITGESGTGKELAARALHINSSRSNGHFEAINCALLRNELLESELFGHEKGSFTGATNQKRGKIELAEGGTLFLDEVGELGPGPQAMLLRVVQEKEFSRLGGTRTIRANVRLIAATNRDLEEQVRRKDFREDLYYRLNVVSMRLPPLRERKEDIPVLAGHFLQRSAQRNKRAVSGLSPAARAALLAYGWPGNVRELENVIEHAVVFGSGDEILPEDLPDVVLSSAKAPSYEAGSYHAAVRQAREQIVLNALKTAGNDFPKAAEALGIHVSNLHRLVRELNLRERLTGSTASG